MALGPVVAAALTDASARSKSLTVGGVEMLSGVGTLGQRIGVNIASVVVTEKMPGRVSEMHFVVDDPLVSLAVSEGMEVRFHDITRGVPIFAGFVQTVTSDTLGLGRTFTVQAVGVEILLDWLFVPSLTVVAGTDIGAAIQAVAAATQGSGYPLRAFSGGIFSTQALPIQGRGPGFGRDLTYDVVISNQTLRAALYQVAASEGPNETNVYDFTVDFYFGLRAAAFGSGFSGTSNVSFQASDWLDPTVFVDGTAAHQIGEFWSHTIDYSQTTHFVFVQGANAAGSGVVTDGAGVAGITETLTDSTSDTAAKRDAIGRTYLARRQPIARGEVTVEYQLNIGSAGTERHAGMGARLIDATLGIADTTYLIGEIEKSWSGASGEIWRITYGGHAPSAMGTLRKMTRTLA